MITELERSRAHIALTRALNVPDHPQSDLDRPQSELDRRKAGLALAVSKYGGDPLLAVLLVVSDALDENFGSVLATFYTQNLMDGSGLDQEECEVVFALIGARKVGPMLWTTAPDFVGEKVELPDDLMDQWFAITFSDN